MGLCRWRRRNQKRDLGLRSPALAAKLQPNPNRDRPIARRALSCLGPARNAEESDLGEHRGGGLGSRAQFRGFIGRRKGAGLIEHSRRSSLGWGHGMRLGSWHAPCSGELVKTRYPSATPGYFMSFLARWDGIWSPRASFSFVRVRRGLIHFHYRGWIYVFDARASSRRWTKQRPLSVTPSLVAHCQDTIFARRLREWREQNRWTQAHLAKGLGVSRSFLCDLEKGRRKAGTQMRRRILQQLQAIDSPEATPAWSLEGPPLPRRTP